MVIYNQDFTCFTLAMLMVIRSSYTWAEALRYCHTHAHEMDFQWLR